MIDNLIDELDSGRELDESMVDDLVDALQPGDGDQWTELETVLRLAEHPKIAGDLKQHELPPRMEAAIAEALDAVLPMLGIHPYGPTYKLADIARRELRREQRKRDAVVEKLDEMGDSDDERRQAEKIMGRYIDTEPAPMFLNEMRTLHSDLVQEAAGGFDELEALRKILDKEPLLADALGHPPRDAEPEKVHDALEQADRGLDIDDRQLAAGLDAEDAVVARLAAGLVLIRDDATLVTRAAHAVDRGSKAAPTLAVVTGLVAPRVARMVFSQFVAEATWQNPELPDAELTESNVRAILSARCVLPHVGSPMERLSVDELPDIVPEELDDLPRRIDELWRFWQQVMR